MNQKIRPHLTALGFSDYEIKAYVALLTHGAMNGYQLAKVSGIPRPNVYSVIERLLQRGAVVSASRAGGSEYQALPAEEMLNRLSHALQSEIKGAKAALQDLNPAESNPLAWNINGYDSLIAKAERMIREARERVLIALWPEEAGRLASALSDCARSGVALTVLCLYGCEKECGGCQGKIYRYPLASDSASRALLLVTDQRQALVGQTGASGIAVAAHSAAPVLVGVATHYILNAIAVAEIVRSLGPKLLKVVDREAMEALKGTGLSLDDRSWFENVFARVNRKE